LKEKRRGKLTSPIWGAHKKKKKRDPKSIQSRKKGKRMG